jgi:hypothetical protein
MNRKRFLAFAILAALCLSFLVEVKPADAALRRILKAGNTLYELLGDGAGITCDSLNCSTAVVHGSMSIASISVSGRFTCQSDSSDTSISTAYISGVAADFSGRVNAQADSADTVIADLLSFGYGTGDSVKGLDVFDANIVYTDTVKGKAGLLLAWGGGPTTAVSLDGARGDLTVHDTSTFNLKATFSGPVTFSDSTTGLVHEAGRARFDTGYIYNELFLNDAPFYLVDASGADSLKVSETGDTAVVEYENPLMFQSSERFIADTSGEVIIDRLVANYSQIDLNHVAAGVSGYAPQKPVVTFTFDDTHDEHFDTVRLVFNKRNVNMVEAVMCSLVSAGNADKISKAELRTMAEEGHELAYHGWGPSMTSYAIDSADALMRTGKDSIEKWTGQECVTVIWPGGNYGDSLVARAHRYFLAGTKAGVSRYEREPALSLDAASALQSQDQMTLNRMGTGTTWDSSFVDMVAQIQTAVNENKWLILMFHYLGSSTDADTINAYCDTLGMLIDTAVALGAEVLTIKEALEDYGNQIEAYKYRVFSGQDTSGLAFTGVYHEGFTYWKPPAGIAGAVVPLLWEDASGNEILRYMTSTGNLRISDAVEVHGDLITQGTNNITLDPASGGRIELREGGARSEAASAPTVTDGEVCVWDSAGDHTDVWILINVGGSNFGWKATSR